MYYSRGLLPTAAIAVSLLNWPVAVEALPTAVRATSKDQYIANAVNGTDSTNYAWYTAGSGQWNNQWWESANCLTTIAELTPMSTSVQSFAPGMFSSILTNAASANGGSFLNNFYDDEGWWAMAWIKVYDVTQDTNYLTAAENIFTDLLTGNDATCGGHWWSKDKNSNTAIANELYLAVAASLANRVSGKQSYYQGYAQSSVDWFLKSGLIASNNLVWNDLNLNGCTPEGTAFTYDSGVIIGALVEMHKLTGNGMYLTTATKLAKGALSGLVDSNGILTEDGYPTSDDTRAMFKGVFARNLIYLQQAAPDSSYVSFLQKNADSIWSNARTSSGTFAADWQGPQNLVDIGSSCSAVDCLVAAAAVS